MNQARTAEGSGDHCTRGEGQKKSGGSIVMGVTPIAGWFTMENPNLFKGPDPHSHGFEQVLICFNTKMV